MGDLRSRKKFKAGHVVPAESNSSNSDSGSDKKRVSTLVFKLDIRVVTELIWCIE
jgi:hypothetical protein